MSAEVAVLTGTLSGTALRVERASGFRPHLRSVEVVPADAWVAAELKRFDGRRIGVHGELSEPRIRATGIWPA